VAIFSALDPILLVTNFVRNTFIEPPGFLVRSFDATTNQHGAVLHAAGFMGVGGLRLACGLARKALGKALLQIFGGGNRRHGIANQFTSPTQRSARKRG
jgi:hypothetical protein